jgi:beta-phosphoglucomutase
MKEITNILFDLDGVLINSMPVHARAWKKTFSALGIVLEDIDIYRREGMSGPASIRDIFLEKKMPLPDEESLIGIIESKHTFFQKNEIRLFAEIDDIINILKSRKIRMGLVTGSHRATVDETVPPGIIQSMSVIVTSDDVLHGKPHPESYIKALKKIGAKVDSTLVIENAPMGIRAAKNAGLLCYAVETTLPKEYLSEADVIFSDHRALQRHFLMYL